MKFTQKHPIIICLGIILLGLLVWSIWGTTALTITEHQITSAQLPDSFDGFRIAQISDLHNAEFGPHNKKLLTLLEQTHPDLIAITGDLLDSRRTDVNIALEFVREAIKIAPVYYIPGNHEARIPKSYEDLKDAMEPMGVIVLENESLPIEKDGQFITIAGLLPPTFRLLSPEPSSGSFRLVLCHRPEMFDWYVQQSYNLILTGHAHGGQIRLPFIGGLYAPSQGFFPKYTSGIYTSGSTSMVVSRGLGNSIFPLRFNNRPELVIITLESI